MPLNLQAGSNKLDQIGLGRYETWICPPCPSMLNSTRALPKKGWQVSGSSGETGDYQQKVGKGSGTSNNCLEQNKSKEGGKGGGAATAQSHFLVQNPVKASFQIFILRLLKVSHF